MKVLLILLLRKCDIILKSNLEVIAKNRYLELININKLYLLKQLNFILNHFFVILTCFNNLDKINGVIRYI